MAHGEIAIVVCAGGKGFVDLRDDRCAKRRVEGCELDVLLMLIV